MGVYRGQIKGALKTSIMWGSLKHSAMHWEKCNQKGIHLDAAVVLGGPPCITYAGGCNRCRTASTKWLWPEVLLGLRSS